ncbi:MULTISPECIES: hypothetical protein [unclassified Blastococcus]
MTMSHGMNVGEVRQLGTQLQTEGGHIQEMVGRIEGLVTNAAWVGPDAEAFKGTEWPTIKAALVNAADQLNNFGIRAIQNADAQEQVSAG